MISEQEKMNSRKLHIETKFHDRNLPWVNIYNVLGRTLSSRYMLEESDNINKTQLDIIYPDDYNILNYTKFVSMII